ncbi:GNAT family N-acetyltransferase [Aurantimonas sp. VKM B-3413]|uniref:GNAT family N-acetyltransferase n=1 Tax=Aurantimonas sp. VKM B-3413 TaxID=2779401 RepID=UPI001E58A286|nr:N-acetyltransferase [Aurantimonas sp. VKM B-3413]MCB8838702.1 N-acetyltransferase [Aurantimonas sp. VKM B-3413]
MSAFPNAAAFTDAAPLFRIASERACEIAQREALLDLAMGPGRTRKSSEAIRRGRLPAEGLALSATGADGALAATVRLWNISAGRRDGAAVPALLLGPLAVDPALQGAGLGGLMMRHAIAEAARLGHGAIILVGDPEYYQRFGFSPEKTARLAMPGPFEPRRLLALEFAAGHLDGVSGRIRPTGRLEGTARLRTPLRIAA